MCRKMSGKTMGRVALVSGVLYAASQFGINTILAPLGLGRVVAFQLTFSRSGIEETLRSWGPEGISLFKTHFYLDFFHPAIYAVFLFSLLFLLQRKLSGREEGPVPKHLYLPFAAMVMDIIENVLELVVINSLSTVPEAVIFITGVVSSLKWALGIVTIIMVVVLFMRLLLRRRGKGPGRDDSFSRKGISA
ncbi:MAG: hypothetical protein JW838_14795 [Spirochaetes bacterium]|nr:hypothetical protein [Spirochaetota bacterium]